MRIDLVCGLPDLPHCVDCESDAALASGLAAADAAIVVAAAIASIIVAVAIQHPISAAVAIATAVLRLVQWPHDAKDTTRGRVGRLSHLVDFILSYFTGSS